ncbi:hypothetical protein N7462_002239 [Penicillium macrosclerotiorum]|uniref:uncharacterized protein n=1 Tax=Penicillium macrosclerotiorum TaxID=303699 RepID=UPI002547EE9E|nr:uncharacterized protein N7462_002239 [Penicillium macrosclerotiorum]KAJ5692816.1 hypothetical protein N7462_002239 [Penicillium macrosclerotiorum]
MVFQLLALRELELLQSPFSIRWSVESTGVCSKSVMGSHPRNPGPPWRVTVCRGRGPSPVLEYPLISRPESNMNKFVAYFKEELKDQMKGKPPNKL